MHTEDLAFVADALLALCDKSAAAPFYTEPIFERRTIEQRKREPIFRHLAFRHGDDALLRVECDGVYQSAGLTAHQADVFTKRLDGWTFEQIGSSGGATKQAAQRVFIQALKKISRALRVYPYVGLSDAYRAEVRRGFRFSGCSRI